MAHPERPITVFDPPFPHGLTLLDLLQHSAGSVAFRLKGRRRGAGRVVITLLHGNEPSGARAVLRLLREEFEPEVDSLLVLGALEAAGEAPIFTNRFLAGRRDRNRVFGADRDHSENASDPDFAFARALLSLIAEIDAEALVDIHNNTGHNPPYGISLSSEPKRLGLVSLFAERAIITDLRLGTLMEATDDAIPSVSIEAGRAQDKAADEVAFRGLQRFLSAESLAIPSSELSLYSHPIRVELAAGVNIAFARERVSGPPLVLSDMLDSHNFQRLESGTVLGWLNEPVWPVIARDADGRDISRELFAIDGDQLCTATDFVPIMMTLDATVAMQDCLFYVVREGTSVSPTPASG